MTSLLEKLDAEMRKNQRALFSLSGYGYEVSGYVQNNAIQFDAIKNIVAHTDDDCDVRFDAARLNDKACFDSELTDEDLKWNNFIAIMLKSDFELVLLEERLCVLAHSPTVGWTCGPGSRPRRSLFVLTDV